MIWHLRAWKYTILAYITELAKRKIVVSRGKYVILNTVQQFKL